MSGQSGRTERVAAFVAATTLGVCLLAGGLGLVGTTSRSFAEEERGVETAPPATEREATTVPPPTSRVTADDSDRTIAVPWRSSSLPAPTPATPSRHLAPAGSRTDDPAWDLIDQLSVWQLIKEDEHLAVEFDQSGVLLTHTPSRPFTSLAEQALDKSPTWVRKELEDSFSRLDAATQDTLANLILDANDPYVDEIAWSVAHLSTTDLTHADFNPQLIVDNANLLYRVDSDVSYAQIVDYGDSVEGGDYYSTVRYKVKEGEEINEYEYSRDIYYWYIVHPRGSDELPTYINPDVPDTCSLMCFLLDFTADPPTGRFWREYFYGCDTDEDGTIDSPCPTHFGEQCDNDHDGTKDGPCPVLRDMLMEADVLWEMKKDVTGIENGAIGQVSDWVHRILGRWGDKDSCRPIQPVVVYYCQDGNCGEYQDMQTAAGRTALIPTVSVDAAPACDHVWNEFYERRWIEWQAEDEQIDHPEGHDGWKGGQAGMKAWRGDGLMWSDSTALYTDTCELVVTITDAEGYPVDGARVTVGSEKSTDLCGNHDNPVEVIRGLTDENGEVSFIIGDSNEPDCRRFYAKVRTDWANYPSSGWTEVIHEPVGGTTYYWDHQFTEFSIPRLSVSPAADPSDPATDNLMEITYSVTEAQGHGTGYSSGNHYREIFTPGDVDFFVADSANYASYTSGDPFEAFEIATDSTSGDISFMPPVAADDWYAVWANQAVMNFSQVVDTTVKLYQNNGYIPPVCNLQASKGSGGEAVLDWESLDGVNVDAYNVYRSTTAADVAKDRTQEELAPFLLATVPESTYTDAADPSPGAAFFYSVRTLGKDGTLAEECAY
jgi:hypothetical protein